MLVAWLENSRRNSSVEIGSQLETLKSSLRPVLTESARRALDAATTRVVSDLASQRSARARAARKGKKQGPGITPWRLIVGPTDPLTFVETVAGSDGQRHRVSVDISCDISEPVDGEPQAGHNIAVRVWCLDARMIYREEWDSESLRAAMTCTGRRVMMRFHFDWANQGQQGPRFHLQIGGKSRDEEYAWLPSNWKLPRFVHTPIDLMLACEFVLCSFYPEQYKTVRDEPTWVDAIRRSQNEYLLPYVKRLPFVNGRSVAPEESDSLLRRVWQESTQRRSG